VVQKLRFLVDRGKQACEKVVARPYLITGVVLSKGAGTVFLPGTMCLSSRFLVIHVAERAVTSDGRYMFPEHPGQGTYLEGLSDP
jgi:hypothetical protein